MGLHPNDQDAMADTPLAPMTPHQAALSSTVYQAFKRQLMQEIRQVTGPVDARSVPSPRPADVVHLREQLHHWWSVPGEWQWRFALQGRRKIEGHTLSDEPNPEHHRWWCEQSLRDAELFWVAPQMCELIEQLAPSIPDCLPQPPCETGFVIFANSIPGTDAETGTPIYTSGLLWSPAMTTIGPCIGMEMYCWRDLVSSYLFMNEKEQAAFRQIIPCRLTFIGGSEWPVVSEISDFSRLEATNSTMEASIIEDRKLLAAFWALCSQKIVREERLVPDRALRRQMARMGHKEVPAVRLIYLREATRKEQGAGREKVNWSHRWVVGSHWRNQWYPSTGQHAPKLIDSYMKGPSDKPIQVRKTVKALVR